jgi:hypothetical protein
VIYEAGPGQRVEEQVEVDHARVGMPARYEPVDGLVVQWRVDAEQAPELVVRADVVAGKDVQTAKAAEQHVFRGPAADAAEACQSLDRRAVLESLQGLQVEAVGDHRLGDLNDRASLGGAEAVPLEVVCVQGYELLRVGERAWAVRPRASLSRGRRRAG